MGCTQVRVKPDHLVNPKRSKLLVNQSRNPSNERNQSTVSLTPMHSTSAMASDRLSVTPGIWNKSEDLPKHASNTLLRSSQSTSRHSIFTTSTVMERKDTPISRISIIKPFDLSSNISDIPEVSSVSITSSDLNPHPSNYDFVVASSKDVNQRVFYQDAIKRFLSSRPKRPINHPISRYRNTWTRPNKSHSLHTDVINSISTYSAESASDLAKDISTAPLQTIQYRTSVKENHHQTRLHRLPTKTSASKDKTSRSKSLHEKTK